MLIITQVLKEKWLKITGFARSQTTNKLVKEAANDYARVSKQDRKKTARSRNQSECRIWRIPPAHKLGKKKLKRGASWDTIRSSSGWRRKNKNLGKICIGWRKSLRVRMYRKTNKETTYYSITKISIQLVIAFANNFEVLCTSLPWKYPWYTRHTWIN